MDGETTFETWQPPKNVMLFESISKCKQFENDFNFKEIFMLDSLMFILEKGFLWITGIIGIVLLYYIFTRTYSLIHKLSDRDFSVMDKLHDRGGIGIENFLVAGIVAAVVTLFCGIFLLELISRTQDKIFGSPNQKETINSNEKNLIVETPKDKPQEISIPTPPTEEIKKESNIQEVQSDNKKTYTKEEVEQMEKEKQYSGDDPIIRERLGLPPKP